MLKICFWEENKSKTWNRVKSCGSQATLPTKVCKHTHTHTHTGSGVGCVDQHTMLAVQANRRSSKHVSSTTLNAPNKPTSLTSTPNSKPRLHQESTPLFSRMKKTYFWKEKEWVAQIRLFLQLPTAERKQHRFRFTQVTNLSSIQVCLCTVLELDGDKNAPCMH